MQCYVADSNNFSVSCCFSHSKHFHGHVSMYGCIKNSTVNAKKNNSQLAYKYRLNLSSQLLATGAGSMISVCRLK